MRTSTSSSYARPGAAPALLALLLAACSGGNDGGDSVFDSLEPTAPTAQLRALCDQEGLAPPPPPVQVAAELVELGQALYFDRVLSGGMDVSCATCHLPEFAAADGRALPQGVGGTGHGPARIGGAVVPRNSPSVLNLAQLPSSFWDARVERLPDGTLRTPAGPALTSEMLAVFAPGIEVLAAQAMFPVTSRDEMRGAVGTSELGDLADEDFAGMWSALTDRLLAIPAYHDLLLAAYPGTQVADLTFAHAANAIAAFEAVAFARTDSPFDRFLRGDDVALSLAEVEGAIEFLTDAGCARCHTGPALTDSAFHDVGQPQFGPGKGDGAGGHDDFGRERVTGEAGDRYRFRTPSLLNVELTAPYGHVGQYAELRDFVRHYRNAPQRLENYDIVEHVDDASLHGTQVPNVQAVLANLDPLVAAPRQFDVDAVVTFLRTLTAEDAQDLSDVLPESVPSGLPFP